MKKNLSVYIKNISAKYRHIVKCLGDDPFETEQLQFGHRILANTRRLANVALMLAQRRSGGASVGAEGPTLKKHWLNVACSQGWWTQLAVYMYLGIGF